VVGLKECDNPRVHVAASGGGHLELLTWIDEALDGHERVWVVSPGSRAAALAESGATVREVPNPGRRIWKFGGNIRAAVAIVKKERPQLIVTSGAGSVVPFCVLARLAGAKVVFVETMARVSNASRSGKVLSRIASEVLVQWPEMSRVYPGSKVCRPALCEEVATARGPGWGTFVAVGTHSEPFDRLLRIVDDAVEEGLLPGPLVAQSGVSTYRPRNYRTVDWLAPYEVEAMISRSRYVVCHAGSGVISSALRGGRRPLVLPRLKRLHEHFDDHQIQLASRLGEMGLVVPLEGRLTRDALRLAEDPPEQQFASDAPSVEEALTSALAGMVEARAG
jgi:UDP-N-acetylglucosamine--N-acetylmuramyl-(pentapeptide) pyrophosphoryl-undecaprenol N-acetylglucosamine transferase